jgi:CRISPR-associated endonuclease/helicase Cas3
MYSFFSLWAKLGHFDYELRHPILCHLMDVTTVARHLWERVQREASKQRFASSLGLTPDDAGRWLAFWAGTHDIGKIAPCFQAKDRSGKARLALEKDGFDFNHGNDVAHGIISGVILAESLADPVGWPSITREFAKRVAVAVGGHHGVFHSTLSWDHLGSSIRGNDRWITARRDTLAVLAESAGVSSLRSPTPPPKNEHALFLFLAGLTSVADWIGSNERYFPRATGEVNWPDYLRNVEAKARNALDDLGWCGWNPNKARHTFTALFPQIREPRPLQKMIESLTLSIAGPRLVLIEAPMGEGKTEAALYLADYWAHAAGHQGLYFALPTQATSNQMFGRVIDFLSRRYPGENDRINAHLLHGQTLLSDRYQKLRRLADDRRHSIRLGDVRDADAFPSSVAAEAWFAQNKKHGLLAPFAVGTIDQALLAVLQTKHVFVRLFGLAGKTIILDEVHAYDTYVSTLLERLLEWLAALGCPVVLLSATLPREKRYRLLEAYHGGPVPRTDNATYPRVSIVGPKAKQSVEVMTFEAEPDRRRTVALEWRAQDLLAADLSMVMKDGGCTAVVCNTVRRAQEVYQQLRDALQPQDIAVELFHARFPFGRRLEIEQDVLDRYGPPADNLRRPKGSVLIATQVIEQSLDLDFDLLVTEVAPVDLVLQRAGRLWRHKRRRPPRFVAPTVWLLKTESYTEGVPDFGASEWVYERYVLLRSYLVLSSRNAVELPGDVEGLIEAVYGNEKLAFSASPAWSKALALAEKEMKSARKEDRKAAATFLVKSPFDEDEILFEFNQQLEEDNPALPKERQAFTRLAEPSVTLVVIYDLNGKSYLDPEGRKPIDLDCEPGTDDVRALLKNAVTLQHKGCVVHYAKQSPPKKWQESGLLRFHRVILVRPDGVALPGEYPLTVHATLGVVFNDTQSKED